MQNANVGKLMIKFGFCTSSEQSYNFVPDIASINGTFIDIPWPTADYPVSGQTEGTAKTLSAKSTTIRDDTGNAQAYVAVTDRITYGPSGRVREGSLTPTFTQIGNNLKIDSINLTNSINYEEVRLTSIGAGMTLIDGTPTVTVKATENGFTLSTSDYRLSYQKYISGALESASNLIPTDIYVITATSQNSYQGAASTATFVRTTVETSSDLTQSLA